MAPPSIHTLRVLSDEQLDMIISIVVDEHGPTLVRVRFNDVVLGLFESLAGLDNLPTKRR